MNELQPQVLNALVPLERRALEEVPKQQALWIGAGVISAVVLGALPLWTTHPELALALSLGAGAAATNTHRWWSAPAVIATVFAAGALCYALSIPAVLGAGAAAGALATYNLPRATDWLDVVNGSLATLVGAVIGLWAATALLPATLPTVFAAAFTCGLVALVASQGLLPSALRFDAIARIPSKRQVEKQLRAGYRPPAFRAIDLYTASIKGEPDLEMRRGLAEVTTWIFRNQIALQTLDLELQQIDPIQVRERIIKYTELPENVDPFTRERRIATVEHLERLLGHREAIEVERGRTEALVDYALAFLEEARAGLAIARKLPGEIGPNRLGEVLNRLRFQAKEGNARRQTNREVSPL